MLVPMVCDSIACRTRREAGALTAEDTARYLGYYAAFFGGVLVATLFLSPRRPRYAR